MVPVGALADEPFQYRGLCLFGLQEQRVVVVTSQHQHDVAAGPHAAHADHLVGRVDVAVLLHRVVLVPERAPVAAEQLLDQRNWVLPLRPWCDDVLDRDNQGRVGDDPQLTVDLGCTLGEHPGVVPGMCLAHVPLESQSLGLGDPFDPDLLADQLEQHPGFQVVIPGVQGSHPGCLTHAVPVLGHPGHDDSTAVGWGEVPVAAHDLEAGR